MRAIGAAAVVALCLAGGAQAKGPDYARVCGASGCTTIRGIGQVDRLLHWMRPMFMIADRPEPAPFYRITVRDGGRKYMTILYAPSRRLMRISQPAPYPYQYAAGAGAPYWRTVSLAGVRALGNAIAGLKPLRAPLVWR